ncbi:phospholipase D-like protein [Promicromonospora sp. AC04]|uniref:PLDc N-terminal domain-containing protein n=1 Tax=Promicromonospora sp. AC04 TaxID=2135723 RepID=UPI000D44D387|nr:PLDc N-terminal domain-containing protein [Promicromonospora sp. AC04]PUB30198.1 phospholipase D-like protein [Promicromonospora sp. AC04]
MPRILFILVVVGLMVYALVDVWGSEEDERGGLPRWLWVLLIVLLPLLGPISWIVVRVTARRSGTGPGPSSGPGTGGSRPTVPPRPGPRRPSGPAAPDDDPEFLWLLEQDRRKREREARGRQDAKDDDAENN